MNFKELQKKVKEINDEMDLYGYGVMLVLDVCEVLLLESNVEEITDELFEIVVECVGNYGLSTDEFSEQVYMIIESVMDNSPDEIKIMEY